MGHSIGDALIVTALAALFGSYLYFRHSERKRRMEIVHTERLAAMEKGIPLPELPLDPPIGRTPPDRRAPLLHGIVWATLGLGFMVTLFLVPTLGIYRFSGQMYALPLPLVFLGFGLILFYVLASDRSR